MTFAIGDWIARVGGADDPVVARRIVRDTATTAHGITSIHRTWDAVITGAVVGLVDTIAHRITEIDRAFDTVRAYSVSM